MTQKELLRRVGSVEQIGGVRDFILNDGRAKGVRAIEISTGNLRFTVLPDRCMDVAQAHFKGTALAWISKTGITAPQFYEKDGKNWLRGFFGGLVTTCGLKNIGGPAGEQGLHGRIANIPAEKVGVSAGWEGDEYVMRVTGEMRECAVFGENLLLRRTITAKLFADEFTLEDTLINQGFSTEPIALCYHCNFGYPLVDALSKITNVPEAVGTLSDPIPGKEEECIDVALPEGCATVGIENESIAVDLTYSRETMPDFLVWKMMGESEYVVGLEPRTTNLGGENIIRQDKFVYLAPFEEKKITLHFSVREK